MPRAEPDSCDCCDPLLGPLAGHAQRFLAVPISSSQRGVSRVCFLAVYFLCSSRDVAHRVHLHITGPSGPHAVTVPFLPFLDFCFHYVISFFFCPWRNIIAVVTVQHLFHFYYHKCHSYTVNTRSATTLL